MTVASLILLSAFFFFFLLICFRFIYCIAVKIHEQIVSYYKIMKKKVPVTTDGKSAEAVTWCHLNPKTFHVEPP